jgi:hypothetical protein
MTKSPSAPARPAGSGRPRPARRDDPLTLLGRLTGRDRLLLDVLADHQVLTTSQITQLAFVSLGTAQRRLHSLHELAVLDRFRWHVPIGSASWHYTLGIHGAALVAAAQGVDPPRPAELRRRLTRLATNPRLGHLLGVNGFFTTLAALARSHPDAALTHWWSEQRCAQHYGQLVRPDGYGAWTDHKRRVDFFLEFDTGSERPLARVAGKLAGYADLATAGGPSCVVLFWLQTAAREAHLRPLLAEHAAVRSGLIVATAAADFSAALGASPAGPVWMRADGHGRSRLVDLSPSPPLV